MFVQKPDSRSNEPYRSPRPRNAGSSVIAAHNGVRYDVSGAP